MIPDFNKHGNLPAGIYRASIDDIEKRFGLSSKKRILLFKNFRNFLELIMPFKTNIKQFILDGSFVTAKENPGDIDCIIVVKNGFRFTPNVDKNISLSKKIFNIDLILHEEKNVYQLQWWIDYFSKVKELKPKGLVEVIL